jgi:hypothetical protein
MHMHIQRKGRLGLNSEGFTDWLSRLFLRTRINARKRLTHLALPESRKMPAVVAARAVAYRHAGCGFSKKKV